MLQSKGIPAYGMPRIDTPGQLPELPKMPPPPGNMPGMPKMKSPTGDNRNQPSPPRMDPRKDPDAVPGGDIEPGAKAGPGFPGGGPPKTPPFDREESIDIIDGKYIPCQEPYAIWTGTLSDREMRDADYRTDAPCLNGIYIGGDSRYTIQNCKFIMEGHGINDFAGIGSAIMTDGTSQVEIADTVVETTGAIRPCIAANGTSVVRLKNCRLHAAGGPLPEGYVPRIAAGMMEPPSGLGIGGTCRASVLLGGAKMYYDHCEISADGWGALSTDSDAPGKYLQCDDCKVWVHDSGYAIFGDGAVECVMNRCDIAVKDYVSMAGASSTIRYHDCDIRSGRFGAMVFGSGAYRVPQTWFRGGSLQTEEAAVYLKGTNAYVSMDGVQVTTGKYLVHTIVDDDLFQEVLSEELCFQTYGMKVALANMTVTGDIVHEEIRRHLAVSMDHVKLTGVIQNAHLSMKDSLWYATGDSTVVLIGAVDVGAMDAPQGVTIRAVPGEGCMLDGSHVLPSGGRLVIVKTDET